MPGRDVNRLPPRRVYGVSMAGVALLVGIALTACGQEEPGAFGGPTFEDAPALVRQRTPLPFCGEEDATLHDGVSERGRECLWDAYQNQRSAEFVSVRTTVEGDPITYIMRTLGPGRVEIFVDHTNDTYSAGRWLLLTCPGFTKIEDGFGAIDAVGGLGDDPAGQCIEVSLPAN